MDAHHRIEDEPSRWASILEELRTVDGLFAVDSSQRIVYWSPAAERILGWRAEEAVGRQCDEIIGGRDERNARVCKRSCRVMRNAVRGRPMPDYDLCVQAPVKGTCWINVSIALADGRDTCVIHLFRDVTNRRSLEERARGAAEPLGEKLKEQGPSEEAAGVPQRGAGLTNRELAVLRLLANGLATRKIAETLAISPITARNHINNLMTKLGVSSRLQAVLAAAQRRLI